MAIELDEWLGWLRQEYLSDFIAAGGSAVKIAVVPPERAPFVLQRVADAAQAQGYLVARVDAAATRAHMIDHVFYAVARQIDWDTLTARWLRALLHENGIVVDEDCPLHDMEAIAEANGRSRADLLGEVQRLLTNSLLRNYDLAKEFRTALAMLCRGHFNPQNVSPSDADVVKQWLHGEKCSLGTLKKMQIFSKIGRHNARLMLSSLALWLAQAGYRGLALLVDFNAAIAAVPPAEEMGSEMGQPLLRYSRSATLDAYEVLRQFIDDTDETQHFLLVVAAGPGLLDDPKRGVDNYTALKMRIVDDVRDRDRANPLNALVRLDPCRLEAGRLEAAQNAGGGL